MYFIRFGITLQRLDAGHLETVRRWRNADWVRRRMRRQEIVSAVEQPRWFARLHPQRDWYFLASTGDGAPFGVFHLKEVDWESRRAEAGAFLGSKVHLKTPAAALATLALMDFAFAVLGLVRLEAQYDVTSETVAAFNQRLGYRPLGPPVRGFRRVAVDAAGYFAAADPYRHAARRRYGDRALLVAPDPWLSHHVGTGPGADIAGDAGTAGNPAGTGEAAIAGNAPLTGGADLAGVLSVAGGTAVVGDMVPTLRRRDLRVTVFAAPPPAPRLES